MKLTRRSLIPAGLLLSKSLLATQLDVNEQDHRYEVYRTGADELLQLWPMGVPGGNERPPSLVLEDRGNLNSAVRGIGQPILQVYRPSKPNGTALLIIPGGGCASLVYAGRPPRLNSVSGRARGARQPAFCGRRQRERARGRRTRPG